MSEIYLRAAFEDKNNPCKHPVKSLKYLTTHYSPHVGMPETMSVAHALFLCEGCGTIVSALHEVSRGYLGSGEISSDVKKEIEKIQKEREIQNRVNSEILKLVNMKGEGQSA